MTGPRLTTIVALMTLLTPSRGDEAAQRKFFEQHVRPVLHKHCLKCHGQSRQKGRLRLDTQAGLLKGGESGPAVVPGKPEESLLIEAVRYESLEMPPDGRLPETQASLLEEWIRSGAWWPSDDGKPARLSGSAFTKEDRSFWSLQPIRQPKVPDLKTSWSQNAIDLFVEARLRDAGITPAPPAAPDVLVRRLFFGLHGLPPGTEEIMNAATSGDISQEWAQLVDRALDNPAYGEHWGRYWLDVVRYAESDGFRADFYRPSAWRYRDYVVRAFNSDMPYDQFVTEQLAGDEVAPDRADALVATGYLRTFLYEYNQRDARTQWQDILNQVTDVTGEVFMGIGVGCARCHDHKFDPVLQDDYFRLQACFATMIPRDDVPAASVVERREYQRAHQAWLSKAADLRAELQKLKAPHLAKAAKGAIERFPADIQEIMAKPKSERVPLEQQLADLVDRQIEFDVGRLKYSEADQKRIDELEKQIAMLSGKPPTPLPEAITVTDTGTVPQIVYTAGDATREPVTAGGLTILSPGTFASEPRAGSTGQRTQLARWLTSRDNPLTARVIVNRVWQQHFGTGLVATGSDFGTLGDRPSHPLLLDWLASEFIQHGWSIKWLHRQILTSATWQMSSFHSNAEAAEKIDPDNRLRWRFDIRRMTAEQIRDSMLSVSGELSSRVGGPSEEYSSMRRSLYLKAMRNSPEPLMRSLDGVDGLNSIPRRSTTTTPTQALNLMNGEWVRDRAKAMAATVVDESSQDPPALVRAAFAAALGRMPQPDEARAAEQLLADAGAGKQSPGTSENYVQFLNGSAGLFQEGALPPQRTRGNEPSIKGPFSVVLAFRLSSLYPDASVRTLVSQWNGSSGAKGWSLGVTSTRSAYQPRNFILQFVGNGGYEVVPSNLRPELNRTYVAAVVVSETDPDEKSRTGQAVFFLQEIPDAVEQALPKLQSAVVRFKTSAGLPGSFPLTIGGRVEPKNKAGHRWNGRIAQVGLFDRAVSEEQVQSLLSAKLNDKSVTSAEPLAFWSFASMDGAGGSPARYPLTGGAPVQSPLERAMTELCHVLLNSNEFIYID